MKFTGICVFVEDMERAKRFYTEVLGQKIVMDMGANVTFEGGYSLQSDYDKLMGIAPASVTQRSNSFELYFEDDDLEGVLKRLEEHDTEFLHKIKEAPWAQRSMQLYDPDGHILEIGESMPHLVRRLAETGLDEAGVSARTGLPIEAVRSMLADEAMPEVVKRLATMGMDAVAISAQTNLPVEAIKAMLVE